MQDPANFFNYLQSPWLSQDYGYPSWSSPWGGNSAASQSEAQAWSDTFQPTDPGQTGNLQTTISPSTIPGDPGGSITQPNQDFSTLATHYANNLDAYYHNHAPGGENEGNELAIAAMGGSAPTMTRVDWQTGEVDTIDASSRNSAQNYTVGQLPPGVNPQNMPNLYGATPEEAAKIYQTLSALPQQDLKAITGIVVDNVPGLDLARQYPNSKQSGDGGAGVIEISRQDLNDPTLGDHILLHEVGHTVNDYYGITSQPGQPWGGGQFVTPYAKTSADEDFAESYAAYYGSQVPGNSTDQKLNGLMDPTKEAALANGNLGDNYASGTEVQPSGYSNPAMDANYLNVLLQRNQSETAGGWGISQERDANWAAAQPLMAQDGPYGHGEAEGEGSFNSLLQYVQSLG